MKLLPLIAHSAQIGFTIEAETEEEAEMIFTLAESGDHWKGWSPSHGRLVLYPDARLNTPHLDTGATIQ